MSDQTNATSIDDKVNSQKKKVYSFKLKQWITVDIGEELYKQYQKLYKRNTGRELENDIRKYKTKNTMDT